MCLDIVQEPVYHIRKKFHITGMFGNETLFILIESVHST